ncbi:putative clathrin assembly protein At2g25430 [Magnolia sinica]|uniref:putative clathrin assembly protein At2g25430 n=1 Tax=Magnolia sinica TaxID=86752 RepID=UPI00265AD854|nr:putative clathrin assembly protein At2g25430 [Magnolia sinica]XP_058074397.1 putative clathrin assembly protein At2g25430 [Magnolia sinica]XP_058074398.1 putative clathrin assembly protein At2g25430 [Magnolia sinica]XP_058074399.1 putative clathrin assembly protein At2g25430 [Magnolia sinica]
MAPSTIRKAIGAVKDQTSIGIAKVSSNTAPDLDVAIVKATSHDDDPADERHVREILTLTSYSRGYVNACVSMVSKRLGKTRDWIVALKSLTLVHRLLADGDPSFQQEILYATRRGTRLLNMSDFRDEAHSNSWDHSAFVRTYALYLDQRLECSVYEKKQGGSGAGDRELRRRHSDYGEFDSYNGSGSGYGGHGRSPSGYGDYSSPPPRNDRSPQQQQQPITPLRDMKPERVLGRMNQMQLLLDRFLACRPTGTAKNSRMVLIALYPVVKESFQLYADICEILAVLLDRFFDMEYPECVKAFEAYARAAKQIDELAAFYAWCKDTGVARSSEYPEVQRITDKLLETLEEFMRDRARRPKSPEREVVPPPEVAHEEPAPDMNSIKALPAPSDYEEPPREEKPAPVKQPEQSEADLLNLRDDAISADDQGNRFALALFSGAPGANGANGSWEAFPSNGESEVTSAWQTPAAEGGKADWELALVESASNLNKQKAALAGGFDPLLLNGMYDQGAVRQHVSAQANTGGSASSVALPGPSKTPVLALPAPDGTVQTVGQDPFAASLIVPPPPYVQMADMEKKQQLLTQEQLLWQQYARDGMQGQVGLAKIGGNGFYTTAAPPMPMPYGMPMPMPHVNGGGYYAPY